MNGHRTSDLMGDFDAYGMPNTPQQASRSSGLMGRLRRAQSRTAMVAHDVDDEEGADPGQDFPGLSIREMNNLGDRHRYPTMDSQSRTMSMASNATYDTTPIIPMLGPQSGILSSKKSNVQYRQRMIDQRKHLLASDTGLPMPGAPGSQPKGRTLSGLSQDPFQGFSNRTMSLSSQRGSRTMSLKGQGPMAQMGPPRPSSRQGQMAPQGYRPQTPQNQHGFLPTAHARRSELDAAQEEVMRLRAQIDQQQQAPQPQAQARRSELHAAQEEVMRLRAQLDQQQRAPAVTSPALENAYNELAEKHRDLTEQFSQLSTQHQSLSAQHRDLGDQHTRLYDQHEALRADHGALSEQHGALDAQHQQLINDPPAAHDPELESQLSSLAISHSNLERLYNDLQDKHEQLVGRYAEAEKAQVAHRELQTKYAALEQAGVQAEANNEDHGALQKAYFDLQNRFEDLTAQHELSKDAAAASADAAARAAAVPTAPAESETIDELRKANEHLTEELHVLSIELAESARRELNLPTTVKPDNAAGHLSRLETELAYERTRRLQAEKHLHVPTEYPHLARSHAEATQLLDMRNQEYDMLQSRLKDAVDTTQVARDTSESTPENARDLDLQYRKLYQHTNFVEQENSRLQKMLDEVSDRGPLADRLKSVEDQRDVLQEALRALRERKDHEIRLLADRSRQLEARLERPRLTSASSTAHVYSAPSHSSVSSDTSQELNGDLSVSSDLDKPLELPRMRSIPRPASPLHINFNMDMYPEQRIRTEQRTSPLPLALGN